MGLRTISIRTGDSSFKNDPCIPAIPSGSLVSVTYNNEDAPDELVIICDRCGIRVPEYHGYPFTVCDMGDNPVYRRMLCSKCDDIVRVAGLELVREMIDGPCDDDDSHFVRDVLDTGVRPDGESDSES